jgi:membrane protease YdiL (CAAX protease family)/thiol-disulfide isomerase/thioredoxin
MLRIHAAADLTPLKVITVFSLRELFGLVLSLFGVFAILRGPISAVGLRTPRPNDFALGFSVGIPSLALIYVLLRFLKLPGGTYDMYLAYVVTHATGLAAIALFLSVAVFSPIVQEVVFRGIVMEGLLRVTNATLAIVVSSLVFAVVHATGGANQTAFALLTGLVQGWLYWRTRSIVAPSVMHILANSLSIVAFIGGTLSSNAGARGQDMEAFRAFILDDALHASTIRPEGQLPSLSGYGLEIYRKNAEFARAYQALRDGPDGTPLREHPELGFDAGVDSLAQFVRTPDGTIYVIVRRCEAPDCRREVLNLVYNTTDRSMIGNIVTYGDLGSNTVNIRRFGSPYFVNDRALLGAWALLNDILLPGQHRFPARGVTTQFLKNEILGITGSVAAPSKYARTIALAPAQVGQPAPQFEIATTAGTFNLSKVTKPVFLELFATWCLPCQRETTVINRLYRAYGSRVQFVGVSGSNNAMDGTSTSSGADIVEWTRRFNVRYPVTYDPALNVASLYLQGGFPTIVLIDDNKRVVYLDAGEMSYGELSTQIEKMLR